MPFQDLGVQVGRLPAAPRDNKVLCVAFAAGYEFLDFLPLLVVRSGSSQIPVLALNYLTDTLSAIAVHLLGSRPRRQSPNLEDDHHIPVIMDHELGVSCFAVVDVAQSA